MKRKRRKGFTLIELVIAIFTSAIVIVAAGMILFFGQRTWNSTWDRMNLQREASYVMLRMTSDIQAGISARVESNGEGLKIFKAGDWVRYFVASEASKLALKSETGKGSSVTIIEDNLEAVQFKVTGNTIVIDLKLKEDNLETHFASTVMMRNYGQ